MSTISLRVTYFLDCYLKPKFGYSLSKIKIKGRFSIVYKTCSQNICSHHHFYKTRSINITGWYTSFELFYSSASLILSLCVWNIWLFDYCICNEKSKPWNGRVWGSATESKQMVTYIRIEYNATTKVTDADYCSRRESPRTMVMVFSGLCWGLIFSGLCLQWQVCRQVSGLYGAGGL